MIQVNQIKDLSDEAIAELGGWSEGEWAKAADTVRLRVKQSDKVFMLNVGSKPVFVTGFIPTSLAGSGVVVWFLGCKALRQHLRPAIKVINWGLSRLPYPRVTAMVDAKFEGGERFATYFGFRFAGEVHDADGTWRRYVRQKWPQ